MYTCNYDVLTDSLNGTSHPCESGWYPDILFDVPPGGIPVVPKGVTQPIFVEACVPYGSTAANYSGEFQLAGNGISHSIPVSVEVWAIDLPRTNASVRKTPFCLRRSYSQNDHSDTTGSDKHS